MPPAVSCVVSLPAWALTSDRARDVIASLNAHGWERVTLLEDPATMGVLVHATGDLVDLMTVVQALPDETPNKARTLKRLSSELTRIATGGR
jgi:hypothetical protein